jgi:hypothetical protein
VSYNKLTDFAVKDSLPINDPEKIVSGYEIDVEFENIETAIDAIENGTAVIDEGVY